MAKLLHRIVFGPVPEGQPVAQFALRWILDLVEVAALGTGQDGHSLARITDRRAAPRGWAARRRPAGSPQPAIR
ncbi:hypothetical protein AB0K15_33285 [Amycolatopsis sp. NPDC049253]|uniref:hypothetical protein n=1 Tax=Amycolatopsis sp. NPDC049253 TaxID=3155274 RepID=UPI00343E15FD